MKNGTADLFPSTPSEPCIHALAPGAVLLRAFASDEQAELWGATQNVIAAAPLRQMLTPGGFQMSVAMTNCGAAGWTTDPQGYRYTSCDPLSGRAWPAMPTLFAELAKRAAARAGFADFVPDACLINRYVPGARMSLHQDKDEQDFTAPIVSVSLGLPATFLFGGAQRRDRPQRVLVESGDVIVWGGPARLTYHGVAPLNPGVHPLTGECRINLTMRKAR